MAKIEMTEEQLNTTIAAAVKAGVEAALAARPDAPKLSIDEQFSAEIAQRKGLDRPPLKVETIPAVTSQSGAMFGVETDHNGRVRALVNYTHPTGYDKHEQDGGIAPNGYPIGDANYKQWLWETFWQADINQFIGKPLPKHLARAQ
jgi:hypothetical protein